MTLDFCWGVHWPGCQRLLVNTQPCKSPSIQSHWEYFHPSYTVCVSKMETIIITWLCNSIMEEESPGLKSQTWRRVHRALSLLTTLFKTNVALLTSIVLMWGLSGRLTWFPPTMIICLLGFCLCVLKATIIRVCTFFCLQCEFWLFGHDSSQQCISLL